jgi:hypothetical protein
MGQMPILQGSLSAIETLNDGVCSPWDSPMEPRWNELSDIQKAAKISSRLLGPPKVEAGIYVSVHASENMWTGDLVVLDTSSNARKWDGIGHPDGIAIGPLGKGCFGWIQTRTQ